MKQLRIDNYIIDTPILEILQRLQVSLTNGKLKDIRPGVDNIVVTCPNNNHAGGKESTAACNIFIGDSTDKLEYGHFRCFVCDDKGSFVKFVSECFDSPEEYAKNWLITNFGVLAKSSIQVGDDIVIGKNRKKVSTIIDPTILNSFQSWHPYLAQRKLTPKLCELFNIKYDPVNRQIVFPTYDLNGRLVMLPRRSIDYKNFYLDSGIEKPVYCLNFIIKNNFTKAIITEGPFDCLVANQYGLPHGIPACATFGNPSDYQIEQINKSGIKVLYTMFDNDSAGRYFTDLIKRKVSRRIIVEEIKIPNGKKDIGELDYQEFISTISKKITNLN